MQNSFSLKQDLTFKEYYNSTVYYFLTGKKSKGFLIVLLAGGFLSMFLGFIMSPEQSSLVQISTSFIPIIFLFLVFLFALFVSCIIAYNSKPYLFKNITYGFTHWGITKTGEKTDFSKPWRDVIRLKEAKSFFLIYSNNIDAIVIQKRMFGTAEELDEFRIFVQDKIVS
jgi:hypothetical protein